MILIADSGSTKTDWCLIGENSKVENYQTQGLNPFHQSQETIFKVIAQELLPSLGTATVNNVFFYGSGCTLEMSCVIKEVIMRSLPGVNSVEVNGDLLGAARALCGNKEGIACILGTGANSCLYDGEQIVRNTPPLGYILGDEGSGAVLGKRFFNLLFKGGLPRYISDDFLESERITMADVIQRVYREPLANRFLASTSLFIHKHLDCEQIHTMVVDNFKDFFKRNVIQYGRPDLPVNAIGSMAYYYKAQLMEAVSMQGMILGRIERTPMEGLLRFHNQ